MKLQRNINSYIRVCCVTDASQGSVKVNFMQSLDHNKTSYKWPHPVDKATIDTKFVFYKLLEAPIPVSGGRLMYIPNTETINELYNAYKAFYF